MIGGSNQAAMALAYIGGELLSNKAVKDAYTADRPLRSRDPTIWLKFIDKMNSLAEGLGMEKTNFVFPYSNHNLNSFSNIHDLLKLGIECMKFPNLVSIATEK